MVLFDSQSRFFNILEINYAYSVSKPNRNNTCRSLCFNLPPRNNSIRGLGQLHPFPIQNYFRIDKQSSNSTSKEKLGFKIRDKNAERLVPRCFLDNNLSSTISRTLQLLLLFSQYIFVMPLQIDPTSS